MRHGVPRCFWKPRQPPAGRDTLIEFYEKAKGALWTRHACREACYSNKLASVIEKEGVGLQQP